MNPLCLFALDASRPFGERVAASLDTALNEHEERQFEDGEHKSRPLESVRGADAFVIQSLYGDAEQSVNDKLVRLLFFIGALKDASAARVTAVMPYLCYARKDRKTKARDPVTTRYIATLLESVGTDHVLTMDVHNLAAYQNAFRCRNDHLEAKTLFLEHFTSLMTDEDLVVMSPDIGGVKRAEAFRIALSRRLDRSVGSAFTEKRRSAGVVSGDAVVGDVQDKTVIIIDDLIGSGTTIARAATASHARGARRIYAAATHGLFVAGANRELSRPELQEVLVTDTVDPYRLTDEAARAKLVILNAAPMFAQAIRRIHEGGSIVALLGD